MPPVVLMPAALANRLREADLTYPEAGATTGLLPPGYHHLRRTVTIGHGTQAFTTAADTLAGWQVHARAGLHVSASAATAELGSVLHLSLGLGAIRIGAPCRVVYVVDEPDAASPTGRCPAIPNAARKPSSSAAARTRQ